MQKALLAGWPAPALSAAAICDAKPMPPRHHHAQPDAAAHPHRHARRLRGRRTLCSPSASLRACPPARHAHGRRPSARRGVLATLPLETTAAGRPQPRSAGCLAPSSAASTTSTTTSLLPNPRTVPFLRKTRSPDLSCVVVDLVRSGGAFIIDRYWRGARGTKMRMSTHSTEAHWITLAGYNYRNCTTSKQGKGGGILLRGGVAVSRAPSRQRAAAGQRLMEGQAAPARASLAAPAAVRALQGGEAGA